MCSWRFIVGVLLLVLASGASAEQKAEQKPQGQDCIIGQGLLPPDLLAKAVREEFVPAWKAR